MNPAAEPATSLSAEEINQRIDEYCQLAFQHHAEPVVVYSVLDHPCPWPGCELGIAGIQWPLSELVEPERRAEFLADFWLGSGIVAACPSCGNLVAYGVRSKAPVHDRAYPRQLPANWDRESHVVLAKQN
jgi:hypothetical protein